MAGKEGCLLRNLSSAFGYNANSGPLVLHPYHHHHLAVVVLGEGESAVISGFEVGLYYFQD